jgi:hypothetical protein
VAQLARRRYTPPGLQADPRAKRALCDLELVEVTVLPADRRLEDPVPLYAGRPNWRVLDSIVVR